MTAATRCFYAFVFGALLPCFGQTAFPITVYGNQAAANLQLPGGISAQLTISFESVVGLNPTALEVTAELVNPLDPAFLLRRPPSLPPPSLPAGFPMLVTIRPSANSSLSFSGVATVELYTYNLSLATNSPLVLLKAEDGQPFRDITRYTSSGSYRAGGSSRSFSQFIIAADLRGIDAIIHEKFRRLQQAMIDHNADIPPALYASLHDAFNQAFSLYTLDQLPDAIAALDAYTNIVKANSGGAIPDVWRAGDIRVNVAGTLRSAADTLRFSLSAKANGRR